MTSSRYRKLDESKIVDSLTALRDRIENQFPDSGLGRVADELISVGAEVADCADYLNTPNWPIRIVAGLLIAGMFVVLYVASPPIDLPTGAHKFSGVQSIAAVLNMDMIGRNEEIPIGGGARFAGLEVQTAESNSNALNLMAFSKVPDITAVVEKANGGIGLELKKRYDNNSSNLLRRSDQWPFLQRGVPAMGFITGLHPDYHTQYDRPEKINYVKMEKIARLVHQVSWDIANADAKPKPPSTRPITQ